ncbi:hypothetical protein JYK14_15635 [Siccirubricoccus sp. KC 17139]|uniref:Glycine zipper domain-containing protein n=1 Tax=Siccirubricoccus soli TaxID=2899147 RepID=A0ABT1D6N3_9PROT|nr:hypothetical protein [Siccirubricoccus soli]MCO6417581.1 hypothetical protein [Siccirubricoccus soli]MCP2683716.1 hypothetical protein [Siccirubricoccus soli]
MALMHHWARGRAALLAALLLLVSACAQTGMMEPGLSPSQQALRQGIGQQQDVDYTPRVRTGETVAEGALLMGLLGAGIGALAGGGRGAAIGAGAGAVAGAGGGYLVAQNAQTQANREAALRAQIDRANADARKFQNYAYAANQVAAEARQRISTLNARYRAGQITAAQFREETSVYQRDLAAMRQLISDGGRVQGGMGAATGQSSGFVPPARAVGGSVAELDRAAADIARSLATVPGGI